MPIIAIVVIAGIALRVLWAGSDGVQRYGASDESIFPFSSLSDWRSYANQLSVVTVERELDQPRVSLPTDFSGCSVELRVERTVWIAPGAQPAPGTIFTQEFCPPPSEREYEPERRLPGPQLEEGKRFLIALVPVEDGYWIPMTGASVLPLDGDHVPRTFSTGHPVASELVGLDVDEIAARVTAAPIDPSAALYMHLAPVERVRAIHRGGEEPGRQDDSQLPTTPAAST